MKTATYVEEFDLTITNDVVCDAEDQPLFENVTCETGNFPVLCLVEDTRED